MRWWTRQTCLLAVPLLNFLLDCRWRSSWMLVWLDTLSHSWGERHFSFYYRFTERRFAWRLFSVNSRIRFFCTNNAQAPSLFSNVTSRRTKLKVWNSFWQTLPFFSQMAYETTLGSRRRLNTKHGSCKVWCFLQIFFTFSCYVGKEVGSFCIVCTKSRTCLPTSRHPEKPYLNSWSHNSRYPENSAWGFLNSIIIERAYWKKEEGHWIFSGYKVNVGFRLSVSCSPGVWKSEKFFMVGLQL